ncbi:MAG: hypothetical protein WBI17_02500 [Clostridiaceae bacterium]
MKETLKPIHFVQYNRIRLQENLEKFLVEKFNLSDTFAEAQRLYGEISTDVTLEDQIDLDNIHNWLESHLVSNEKRNAMLLKEILRTNDVESLKSAYSEYGNLLGLSQKDSTSPSGNDDIYSYTSSILLDGMPCDKVNSLISSDDTKIEWHGQSDVHGKYLVEQGLEAKLFYTLRESFLDSLLKTKGNYTYQVNASDEKIVNEIIFGA